MSAIITDEYHSKIHGRIVGMWSIMARIGNVLDQALVTSEDWGIKKGEWYQGGEWYYGPPDYTIVHCCPRTLDSNVVCLERWDMKTMRWKCEGCGTAPSDTLITLWKIMGGSSLLWEDDVPEGTDLIKLNEENHKRLKKLVESKCTTT